MATKAGIGREIAHEIMKKYAVAEALKMRSSGSRENTMAKKIADDAQFNEHGITQDKIEKILADKTYFIGETKRQIKSVATDAYKFIDHFLDEARPEHYPGSRNPGYL